MDMAGTPARLADMVKMSERYMVSGSEILSPILKATVGDVGVMMTSKFSNTLSKSCFISVLTFFALK